MGNVYFAGGVLLVCLAHLIRVCRWESFIRIYEKPKDKNLIQSLSIGYLLNYILPFKLGDLARAWLAGRKMKNGKALGLSTVIVDRYLDVVAVGIIFSALYLSDVGRSVTQKATFFYIAVTVTFLVVMLIIYICKGWSKKVIRAIAGIFNNTLEESLLQFAWSLVWNFKDIFQKINKGKMVLYTIGMWLLYLSSYFCFASFLVCQGASTTWVDIFMMLFIQNGIKKSTGVTIQLSDITHNQSIWMALYMVLPILILFVISLSVKKENTQISEEESYLNLFPHLDSKERLAFLENYFSNENRAYIANYLRINQGISIIRDYSAGSNATTMLCTDGTSTFFRKYAFGADGEKLYRQVLWIEENKNRLTLPEILRHEKTDIYCYYDMLYKSNAVGLFEYVHSMPVEKGWHILQKVLESLEQTIYKIDVRQADRETIHKYISLKVRRNLGRIKNAKWLKPLQTYKNIIINGVEYMNLPFFEKYFSEEYLWEVFKDDTYAIIHGDLTIENIICKRDEEGRDDFYIIDPNTGNVHDSPNLDYGKLLQSIHGGYEFLMSIKDVTIHENKIDFLFIRSSIYVELHKRLKDYLCENFGYKRTRSIYFHEIIHWLRLMPYKIERIGKQSLLFYAGMLMVMNDVIEMYGNEGGSQYGEI